MGISPHLFFLNSGKNYLLKLFFAPSYNDTICNCSFWEERMKVGSNYHGVNMAKEKARDNFAAEINQLKTEKIEDVDKIKRDYDVRLKHNIRANREWANTAIQEREKDFLSELQRQANTYKNDRENVIEGYENRLENLKNQHAETLRQHDDRTQSLLRENTDKLNSKFDTHMRKFKEFSRRQKMSEINELYKNYQNDLKREGQIHKLQQNHSENLYQNSLTDIRAKQRIQSQKQENALKNAVEDARYERGQLIRDYEVKLGNRPD